MLKIEDRPAEYDGSTLADVFRIKRKSCLTAGEEPTLKDKMDWLTEVVKGMSIAGCITGSYFLPGFDPDAWGATPDVDVFVFGEKQLIHAVDLARYALKMTPGSGTERSKKQEEWKIKRLFENGLNHKIGVTTYKFCYDGVVLNLTFKQMRHDERWYPVVTTPDVLRSFDMSIVMQGYDIQSHTMYDMRVGDPMVAIPNPTRKQDFELWTVQKWIRQFDRVVKYYNRVDVSTGRNYDTRPMAEFYLKAIDGCISAGSLFDSEESKELFEEFKSEFEEQRKKIVGWLDEHKED